MFLPFNVDSSDDGSCFNGLVSQFLGLFLVYFALVRLFHKAFLMEWSFHLVVSMRRVFFTIFLVSIYPSSEGDDRFTISP